MAVAAVLDTNIWVSAFLHPRGFPARLVEAGEVVVRMEKPEIVVPHLERDVGSV